MAYLRRWWNPTAPSGIGRIATDPAARGRGLAARLLAAALDGVDGPVVLDAQEHLEVWYVGLGFERTGLDLPRGRHPPRPDEAGRSLG